MREIKFRARNANVPRCWIYGYYIEEQGHSYIINKDGKFPVNAETVGQFTGLKGNGKEIYEGDIVIGEEPVFVCKVIGSVKYQGLAFSFQGKKISGEEKGEKWFYTISANFTNDKDIEVVGNVYENPEMFNEEKTKGRK